MIYFSKKRENVLVYLSNAIEKYCKETNFSYDGIWQKWAAYGFDKDGRQRIEEYYPNAATSSVSVKVSDVEFIPDAYTAILEAEQNGLVTIVRYDEMTEEMQEWLREIIKKNTKKL